MRSPGPTATRPNPRPETAHAAPWRLAWQEAVDLAVAVVLSVLALVAALQLEPRSLSRMVLVAPLIFVVPGYLLIQAVIGPSSRLVRRPVHAAFSLGVTPAVLGLLGLGTTLLPGGFQSHNILFTVTIFCVVCGAVAVWRRGLAQPEDSGASAGADSGSAHASS